MLKKFTKIKKNEFTKEFKKIIKRLTLKLKLKDNVFVHRDFHVSNLMLVGNRLGVIDSQDALIGNKAYDLASLIDDVRLKTLPSIKKEFMIFILENRKNQKIIKLRMIFKYYQF